VSFHEQRNFFERRAITDAWGGNTTVSLLVLLDLQNNSLFLVFLFLVPFVFAYTHKVHKNHSKWLHLV
jgi:hypothetical protein